MGRNDPYEGYQLGGGVSKRPFRPTVCSGTQPCHLILRRTTGSTRLIPNGFMHWATRPGGDFDSARHNDKDSSKPVRAGHLNGHPTFQQSSPQEMPDR
jgi:hypothetical protein